MKIRNASRWVPYGVQRWYGAAFALLVASGVRLVLHPWLGPIMPGTAYFVAAALTAYYFGMAPAFAVIGFGFLIADYLFVPPYHAVEVLDQSDLGLLISLPVVSMIVIVLIENLRRAQFRAELLALVAQSRYEMLLRADNERVMAKRAVDETHRLLRHLPHHHDDIILIQALERHAVPASVAAALAPGTRYEQIHTDDLKRLSSTLTPGHHRVRIDSGAGKFRTVDCVCERFTTHAGDFLVLRLED